MKEIIRKRARELGFDLCGFTLPNVSAHAGHFQQWIQEGRHGEMEWMERTAPKRIDPRAVLDGVKTIIALGISYGSSSASTSRVEGTGTIARYARFRDYHRVLERPLRDLAGSVDALAGPGHRSLWYKDTGPLLERDLAQRAGIGFIGKHSNVISRQHGNWILLAEILTTLEIEPDPPEKNRCGHCQACITACPTAAITEPFRLDARRCISYLTIELKGAIPVEFRRAIGNRIFGCDDCLAVCPWNRFAQEGRLMREHARADLEAMVLIGMLAWSEEEFRSRFAGTPILRAKRRGFLRNVCVALGNVGDRDALPHLEKAAQDPDPLIAEHAAWARTEIELRLARASPV